MGFPGITSCKESTCQCRRHKRWRFDPWVGKIPSSKKWQPIPVFLPGKPNGQRSLVGYSPWGCRVWHDWAHVHSILTCFQDGRGETNNFIGAQEKSVQISVGERCNNEEKDQRSFKEVTFHHWRKPIPLHPLHSPHFFNLSILWASYISSERPIEILWTKN